MKVMIVDYGVGNLGAIPNMLARIGVPAVVTSEPADIASADRLILPGVGAFDAGMGSMLERGLVEPLRRRAIDDGVPTLGLCLGMELLFDSSEEGSLAGLGWIPGDVVRFRLDGKNEAMRVPHMGWNDVQVVRETPLVQQLGPEPRFYFAHSFHAQPREWGDVVATMNYGYEVAVCVQRGNIAGAQFHPEKSHRFGLQFLRNFVEA